MERPNCNAHLSVLASNDVRVNGDGCFEMFDYIKFLHQRETPRVWAIGAFSGAFLTMGVDTRHRMGTDANLPQGTHFELVLVRN